MTTLNVPKCSSGKLSKQKRLEILTSDKFMQAYDEWIQQHDFDLDGLMKELKDLGYRPAAMKVPIKHELLKRKIWKKDGKLVCTCGFRCDDRRFMIGHRLTCEEYKKYFEYLKNKYFSVEAFRENLDSGKFEVLQDYLKWVCEQENIPEHDKMIVFRPGRELAEKYHKEGLIEYSTDSQRVKNAMGRRASKVIKEKYGVDNASQLEWVKEKKRQTFQKNWGADHYLKTERGKQHVRQIFRQKYGVDNPSQIEAVKQKKRKTYSAHWGVDNIFKETRYIKQKLLEKLGVDNPTKDIAIRERAMQGILKQETLYKSQYEDALRDIIVDFLNQQIKVVAAVTTNEQGNQHYKVDTVVSRLCVPDIQITLSDDNILVINIHGSIHRHPLHHSKIEPIWYVDLREAVFYFQLAKHYYFTFWHDDQPNEHDIIQLLTVIVSSIHDPQIYSKYFIEQIWNIYPPEIRSKISFDMPDNIEIDPNRQQVIEMLRKTIS